MTSLQTDCLGKTPLTKEAVQVIYDLREDNRPPAVLQTWIKNLCLSHERLRMENAGLEIVWKQAQAVINRLKEQIKATEKLYKECDDIGARARRFIELEILKRILGNYK